jgi:hypothetical protein
MQRGLNDLIADMSVNYTTRNLHAHLATTYCHVHVVVRFSTARLLTKLAYSNNCHESRPSHINLSKVQGSGLGPSFYSVYESDLKPLSSVNIIFKYADDTNLLVSEHTGVQLCDEFDAIQKWAVI